MHITLHDIFLLFIHIVILIHPVTAATFITPREVSTQLLSQHNAYICAQNMVWSGVSCVCDVGFYRADLNSDACQPCPTGTFKATVDLDLSTDQLGGLTPLPMENECQSCPPDSTSYAGASSSDECVCTIGHYHDGTKCENCPVNTFKDYAFDATSCVNCPLYTESPSESDAPSECECKPGYEMSSQTTGGLPTCAPCPDDEFKAATGNVQCQACHAGASVYSTPAVECQCDVGFYEVSATQCDACPADHTSPVNSPAKSSCVCVSGFSTGASYTCTPCAVGSYSTQTDPLTAVLTCTSCPDHETTAGDTSTSSSDCVCDKGYYRDSGECKPCAAGFFKSAIGDQACSPCGINVFSLGAAELCADCPTLAVTAPESTDITACQCPAGHELQVQSEFVGTCAQCDPGHYSANVGANCESCDANEYQPSQGQDHCEPCPFDSQSPAGSSEIAQCLCDAGFSRSGDSCAACLPGHVKPTAGNTACQECTENQYSTDPTTVCDNCPTNTFTNGATGQSVGSACRCVAGMQQVTTTSTFATESVNSAGAPYFELDQPMVLTVGQEVTVDWSATASSHPFALSASSAAPYELPGSDILTQDIDSTAKTTKLTVHSASTPLYHMCVWGHGFQGVLVTIQSATDAHTCEPCDAGFYCPGYSIKTECISDSVSTSSSQSVENCKCKAGYYRSSNTVCADCPTDHYCEAESDLPGPLLEPTDCPNDSYSPANSFSVDHCTCDPGYERKP